MPSRSWPAIRRNNVDVIGKSEHGHIIWEFASPGWLVWDVILRIPIKQDGFELPLQGVHTGRGIERFWDRNNRVVVTCPSRALHRYYIQKQSAYGLSRTSRSREPTIAFDRSLLSHAVHLSERHVPPNAPNASTYGWLDILHDDLLRLGSCP